MCVCGGACVLAQSACLVHRQERDCSMAVIQFVFCVRACACVQG